jgi:hypothetical protein
MRSTLTPRPARYFQWIILLFCMVCSTVLLAGEPVHLSGTISWNPVQTVQDSGQAVIRILSFKGSVQGGSRGLLPQYLLRVTASGTGEVAVSATLSDMVFQPLTPEETEALGDPASFPVQIEPQVSLEYTRKVPVSVITFFPFRQNPGTGMPEKLVSFQLTYTTSGASALSLKASSSEFASHSVLATGTWYKFAVTGEGIYKLTYEDLKNTAVSQPGVDPRTIRIFSNGGGMVPEANSAPRYDDLTEQAIQVVGEEDGSFDPGDYILFFGQSQDRWHYDTQGKLFHHIKNVYSDKTYYFLTFGNGQGKRIQTDPGTTATPTNTITRFNDYAYYEQNTLNLIQSGREWYDQEYFDVTSTRTYSFQFPHAVLSSPGVLTAVVAARSTNGSSSFTLGVDGQVLGNISIPSVPDDFLAVYARERSASVAFTPTSETATVTLTYNRPDYSAIGYLNYLEVNVMRDLVLTGGQMEFRSVTSAGAGKTAEFKLSTQGQPVTIWDVTTMGDPFLIQASNASGQTTFRVATDTLREFIAFDGSTFLTPELVGQVGNQDLHGTTSADLIIISHPDFLSEAERLAEFHRTHDGMDVLVTTTDKVYNEFSSGSQDISAIRDFLRMLYTRGTQGKLPRYLLLFGDASYDYLDRGQNNSNFIPAYESPESLDPIESYVTDDFFVLLDPNEGSGTGGSLDMGVGRLPVLNTDEARSAVDKILKYSMNSDTVRNDWRNVLCFVADDEDGDLHMQQAEALTSGIKASYPVYNIDKIYVDAYQQIATPGGQRAPDVNDAINKRIGKGALVISYTGHGGEVGWGHERFLEVADIDSWTNLANMPVFVTATCEFSRYDDPSRASAGELVFLNPTGGGIALFTTARPTFAGSNFSLATNFFDAAFQKVNGQYLRLGDLIMNSKNSTGASANTRKFVLLGDPALMMAYPEHNVITTSVTADTLKALSQVTISGEVHDYNGLLMTGFDGQLFTTVFDKPTEIQTLGDNGSPVMNFDLQKNQIYKGQAQVSQGTFSFSFIVPKDIAYNFGGGKISYYARSSDSDANGYDDITVGGYDNAAFADNLGPGIQLFMNDRNFVNGGITNENPVLLAYITDESGINTVGNGIGHDITLVLDEESQNPSILNDYYVSDLDTYKSGSIGYPLFNLSPGRHHLTLKAWDVYNNSSSATISFLVVPGAQAHMVSLYNYPNPFQTSTTFTFESNQADVELNLKMQIFNMYGNLVRTLQEDFYAAGYRTEPFVWDGTDDNGNTVGGGMYVYRLVATLPDGRTLEATSKLIKLN